MGITKEARKIKIRELRRGKEHSLAEVANYIGIEPYAIYPLLREIAKEDGVPYRDLLDTPHYGYHRTAPYVNRPAPAVVSKPTEVDGCNSEPSLDDLLKVLQKLSADCADMLTILQTVHKGGTK